jgi:hypothetical protein
MWPVRVARTLLYGKRLAKKAKYEIHGKFTEGGLKHVGERLGFIAVTRNWVFCRL